MAKQIELTRGFVSLVDDKVQQRFWAKVQKTDTCWLWTGKIDNGGYGTFKINHKYVGVHRFIYELENGSIPASKFIRHNCNTKSCVNPSHLYLAVPKSLPKVDPAERRANRYGVLGEQFCISNNLIPLSKGKYATVDNIDFEYLSQFNWHCRDGYAFRTIYDKVQKRQFFIGMHHVILERKLGRKLAAGEIPDHVHGNPLNNTRQNLRVSTNKQNTMNKLKTKSPTSSRFKGVTWSKAGQKWNSRIRIDGELIHIGVFTDEAAAARAYDQTALLWFREFAKLNFPNELKLSEILVSNS